MEYRASYRTPAQNSKTNLATSAKRFENVMVHLTEERPDLQVEEVLKRC